MFVLLVVCYINLSVSILFKQFKGYNFEIRNYFVVIFSTRNGQYVT